MQYFSHSLVITQTADLRQVEDIMSAHLLIDGEKLA